MQREHERNLVRLMSSFLSAAAAAVLVVGTGAPVATATEPCNDFGECKMLIEINATDGDIGFHFLLDGDLTFKRSSQHLTIGELRWRRASVDDRTVRYVRECVHLAVRRLAGGRIVDRSGRPSPGGCRARKREWRPACLRLSEPDGFATVGA